MPDPKPKIPTWDDIYGAKRAEEQAAKDKAEQNQPGYIPPGWESWIVAGLTGERKIAAKRLAINGQLTKEALRDILTS